MLNPPKGVFVPRPLSAEEATAFVVAPLVPNSVPPLTNPAVEEAGLEKPPPPPKRDELVLVLVLFVPPNSVPGLVPLEVRTPPKGEDTDVEVPPAPKRDVVLPNRPPVVPPGLAEKLPNVPAGLVEGLRPKVGGPDWPTQDNALQQTLHGRT